MKRLPEFVEARKRNWLRLREGLAGMENYLEFALPTHATSWTREKGFTWDDSGCKTDCSWFGFKITVKETAPFTRTDLAQHLDKHKIGNRMLFGGNLLRQPAFVHMLRERPGSMRVVGELEGADRIMNQTLFLGTYPGLTETQLNFMIQAICEIV